MRTNRKPNVIFMPVQTSGMQLVRPIFGTWHILQVTILHMNIYSIITIRIVESSYNWRKNNSLLSGSAHSEQKKRGKYNIFHGKIHFSLVFQL